MSDLQISTNAYILAGGEGRRFKSDKSLAKIGKKSMTEILFDRFNPVFEQVLIVGKENKFGDLPFLHDKFKIQCPLNGIVTALQHSEEKWSFIIACDLPLIQTEMIHFLYQNVTEKNHAILPTTDGKIHGTCAFYNSSALPIFLDSLKAGNYSLYKNFPVLKSKIVEMPEKYQSQFLNVNRCEDFIEAKKRIAKN